MYNLYKIYLHLHQGIFIVMVFKTHFNSGYNNYNGENHDKDDDDDDNDNDDGCDDNYYSDG